MELEFPRFFLYLATDVCQDTSDATDELDSDNDRRVIYQQKFASAIVPFSHKGLFLICGSSFSDF